MDKTQHIRKEQPRNLGRGVLSLALLRRDCVTAVRSATRAPAVARARAPSRLSESDLFLLSYIYIQMHHTLSDSASTPHLSLSSLAWRGLHPRPPPLRLHRAAVQTT